MGLEEPAPDVNLREAVGLDVVGVLVHQLYLPGGWHGGGETVEVPAAMGMELERGEGAKQPDDMGWPLPAHLHGLEAPPSHSNPELRDIRVPARSSLGGPQAKCPFSGTGEARPAFSSLKPSSLGSQVN